MNLVAVAATKLAADPVPRNHLPHRGLAFPDDARVVDVERDPQPIDASGMPRDRPVAQVQAEEIDVVGTEPLEAMLVRSAAHAGFATFFGNAIGVGKSAADPFTDRRPGDAGATCDLAVVQARLMQLQGRFYGGPIVHAEMRAEGIEPTRAFAPPVLSRCCLPVPARPLDHEIYRLGTGVRASRLDRTYVRQVNGSIGRQPSRHRRSISLECRPRAAIV